MTKTIGQRELHNESAPVIRAVEHGATVIVTRNGTPVAKLRPVRRRGFVPTTDLKRTLAAAPAVDYDEMRAEMDSLLVRIASVAEPVQRGLLDTSVVVDLGTLPAKVLPRRPAQSQPSPSPSSRPDCTPPAT